MWALADPGGTYAQGKTIAANDSDADAAGQELVTALDGVQVGSDHGGSALGTAVDGFRADTNGSKDTFGNAVSKLGENTAEGARTGVQTNNDGAQVANANTARARDLTARTSGPVAV